MKTSYLFPNYFKSLGWVLFSIGILGSIFWLNGMEPAFLNTSVLGFSEGNTLTNANTFHFGYVTNNIFNELTCVLLIIGAVLVVFSKQKYEDEYISKIRLDSLVWAVYVNYLILLLAILLIYNFSFFMVLVANMFTILVFFMIRFNWVLAKTKKGLNDEK